MAADAAPTIVLYGKPGCCLCEEAEPVAMRAAADFGLTVSKRSILQDPAAFARYCYRIPVLVLGELVLDEGRVDEGRLRQALADALRPTSRSAGRGISK